MASEQEREIAGLTGKVNSLAGRGEMQQEEGRDGKEAHEGRMDADSRAANRQVSGPAVFRGVDSGYRGNSEARQTQGGFPPLQVSSVSFLETGALFM